MRLRHGLDTRLGTIGEGYSPLMAVLPMAYRVWDSPAELYDGIILVSNAHPIEIRNIENH